MNIIWLCWMLLRKATKWTQSAKKGVKRSIDDDKKYAAYLQLATNIYPNVSGIAEIFWPFVN